MEKSTNYKFNLPNSANDEIADINDISDNFRIIDEVMNETDQTFKPTSTKAASGKAVNEAIEEAGSFFSNALQNTVSGSILRLDDVSPAQKKLTANISSVDGSAPNKAYVYDKNILNSTLWIPPVAGRGVTYEYLPEEDCFLINGTTAGESSPTKAIGVYALGNKFALSVKYVSGNITVGTGSAASAFIQKSESKSGAAQTFFSVPLTNSGGAKVSAACDKDYLKAFGFYVTSGIEFNNYKIKIQLEFGNVATTYKKFVEPIELAPDSSGNVGFNPKDNMTLMLPSPGVINIKYSRDINKAFDELKQAIASMGASI